MNTVPALLALAQLNKVITSTILILFTSWPSKKKLHAYAIKLGLTVRCSLLSIILFWTIIASVDYVIITPASSMHQLIRAKGPINIPISKYTLDLSLRKSPHNVRRIHKNRSFYFLLGLSLVLPTILITVATSSSFTA